MAVITLRQFVKDLDANVQRIKIEKAISLARGSIANMESYHRQVGQGEGMEQAVAIARQMLTQLAEAEEDNTLPEMES